MKKIVIALGMGFIVLLTGIVDAATFGSEKEIKPFADSIMERVTEGNFKGALTLMNPYLLITETEFESLSLKSLAQKEQYENRYGRSWGYEFIHEQNVGHSLLRLVYIEKTEKQAIPWVFYFYKTRTGWTLNSFYWNDQLQPLFELDRQEE